jgi:Zn-dependent protease
MHLDPNVLLAYPVCLLSLVAHECAHGGAALLHGDSTAREAGRLTSNPRAHFDPLGSFVVPLVLGALASPVLFAWARPIPVDRARLRRPRHDSVRVALAGPAANILIAIGFAAISRAIPENGSWIPLRQMAVAGVAWNCGLALFHLIPIPPLDGSWVLKHFLRLRHIIALQHARHVALGLVVAAAFLPPSRGLFALTFEKAVGTCLGLFGLDASGMSR